MPADFSAARWERAYRRIVKTAFLRVPFYRDQWVSAGRALDEPEPTPSAALTGQLHRLCPFAQPFDASREPSLWIDEGRELRDALSLVGAPSRTPVLEVRAATLDRRALPRGVLSAWIGPRYGVLLPPGAKVLDEGRRRALNTDALHIAAEAGRATLIGERAALDALLPELDGIEVNIVERMTAAHAVRSKRAGVVHDPHLGYFAASATTCGRIHLLWRHFHAHPAGRALTVTALRRTRPTLVNVIPDDSGSLITAVCPEHGAPIVSTH
ncbi:hypothetical protein ACIBF6_15790 [Streptosporangium amethystogenes]|uniref:hypothetical protein n=1 Tax=Streptosporangium amethystogenes TaxID=2002 RepID=UPI0037BCA7BB